MALACERPQSRSPGAGPMGMSQVSGGGFRAVVDARLTVIKEARFKIAMWGSEPLEWEVCDWSSKQRPSHSPGDPHGDGDGEGEAGGVEAGVAGLARKNT